jgi:hypothetical protein
VGNVDLDEFSILQRKLRYMYRHAKDPGSQPRTHARTRARTVALPNSPARAGTGPPPTRARVPVASPPRGASQRPLRSRRRGSDGGRPAGLCSEVPEDVGRARRRGGCVGGTDGADRRLGLGFG